MHLCGGVPFIQEASAAEARDARRGTRLPRRDRPVPDDELRGGVVFHRARGQRARSGCREGEAPNSHQSLHRQCGLVDDGEGEEGLLQNEQGAFRLCGCERHGPIKAFDGEPLLDQEPTERQELDPDVGGLPVDPHQVRQREEEGIPRAVPEREAR